MKSTFLLFFFVSIAWPGPVNTQVPSIHVTSSDIVFHQIDGFGAHQGNAETNQAWWQELYYDDLGATMYRVDLTPRLISPYSDLSYYSPWFMGSQTDNVFNLEDPDNPDGPEGNRVRTYSGPEDYGREFGGLHAPIAVMGPDIEENIKFFTFPVDGAIQAGIDRKEQLGDFKLIGSLWSPVPWVKVSSGHEWNQSWWPGPVFGSPWPFIWGGNFAGGRLDVSGTPLEVFDDSALGGTGPTSSLTQFARSTAAYVLGYQRAYNTTFYAISIQNELNFEEFYNSATYPLSSQWLTALKAIRNEFDNYPELAGIRLMGPEDLLGGDAYGMYEYGGPIHKNLQYLKNLALDPEANQALDLFCVHGYASDGVSSAGANPQLWDWWVNGWTASPAPGLPSNVKGIINQGKKSWMTETSGENPAWLWPQNGYPSAGGWSIALKLHQALTTGMESAWLYWTFTEDDGTGNVTPYALTNEALGSQSPKFVAAKHFFKFIPPGAWQIEAYSDSPDLLVSAYVHPESNRFTVVILNTAPEMREANLFLDDLKNNTGIDVYRSDADSLWVHDHYSSIFTAPQPFAFKGYSITTLTGFGDLSAVEGPGSEGYPNWNVSPNPSAGPIQVVVDLPESGEVTLALTTMDGFNTGQEVTRRLDPGPHTLTLDPGDVPAGIYVVNLILNGRSSQRTVVITR